MQPGWRLLLPLTGPELLSERLQQRSSTASTRRSAGLMALQGALYLTVFLAKGLHPAPQVPEDALLCAKERGKEEKPRTVKIYFCF